MKKHVSLMLACLMSVTMFGCNQTSTPQTIEVPKYSVEVSSSIGGSVTASDSEVDLGEAVVLTVAEQDGYVLASLTINGNKVDLDGNTYTIGGAMRDYKVVAQFVKTDVTVSFSGDGADELDEKGVVYGSTFGKLPTPAPILGKRFAGWIDENGKSITEASIVGGVKSEIELFSTWEDVTEEEKALMRPTSITTAYHDMAATKYGVVWHNKTVPAYPVMLIQEGETVAKDTARMVKADYEYWFWDEYTVNAVVDGLKFNTTYTVQMGDYAADVWSDSFTFTTREEYVDEANFIFISDTQENYLIENMGNYSTGYLGTTYSSQVLKEATARFPEADYIAHGGDMVNWGIETKYWEEMLGSYEEFLFQYPMMITTGNHSEPLWYGFGSKNNIENKLFNVDWEEDLYAASGMLYSFDYGPMHFVSLRSNDVFYDQGNVLTDGQINWFINDVNKARQNENTKWVVVMMHEGPIVPEFTSMNSNHHSPSLGGQLIPLFDELEIDLLLYGHNHYLDTTYPIVWDETATPQPNTDKTFPGYPNAKPLTVRAVTKQTEEVTLADGTVVDKIVYPEGTTKRGTVYHQIMTSGPQVNTTYKYDTVAERYEALGVYRILASGGVGALEINGAPSTVPYCGYSYVQVAGDSLTVRSYGVYAKGVYNETDPSKIGDHAVYLDGFMLTK